MEPSERLYLSTEEDIFIDIPNIPQHQVDGVRFLYKQFQKGKKGVIVNDPPGYGKTLQVVLFLNATRKIHPKSNLILCSEAKAEKWMQYFQEWTMFDDTVVQEAFNPNRKRMAVCINSSNNIAPFAQRNWSVLIIDDNENMTDILKYTFKATYKIWISSEDMKKNLSLFSTIHKWLKLEEGLTVDDFITDKMKVPDDITRYILLDAFMQDVVLRRKEFKTPLKDMEKTSIPKLQPTRKNKDITGTKIKRSKKTSSTDQQNKVDTVPNVQPNPVDDKTNEPEMDIETFISTQKPIELDDVKEKLLLEDIQMYDNSGTNTSAESNTSIEKYIASGTELDISKNSTLGCEDTNSKINKELDKSNISLTADDVGKDMNLDSNKTIESDANKEVDSTDITRKDEEKEMSAKIKEKENIVDNPVINEENVTEKKSRKTIDVIMQEMEEKFLKKYKGSPLDNIF